MENRGNLLIKPGILMTRNWKSLWGGLLILTLVGFLLLGYYLYIEFQQTAGVLGRPIG